MVDKIAVTAALHRLQNLVADPDAFESEAWANSFQAELIVFSEFIPVGNVLAHWLGCAAQLEGLENDDFILRNTAGSVLEAAKEAYLEMLKGVAPPHVMEALKVAKGGPNGEVS